MPRRDKTPIDPAEPASHPAIHPALRELARLLARQAALADLAAAAAQSPEN
ncbi:hypothetical protein [Paracoccus yeei]|uniref:hypothetical protein n=1 Tax=Paracoccus yeei TaxID=147645 RepID=UPI00168444C2|nr:hypothetical protein [Paracoccus yeei]MBY0138542.1 hypothetical protein [Paracoccus yeei]